MTDKFDWDASPSIKSTPGVIKSSSSNQVNADGIVEYAELGGTHRDHQSPGPALEKSSDGCGPSPSHQTLSFTQLERQLGHLVLPTDLQGSEIPEAEGAKFRNQRECHRFLFKILFLVRFNLDNRVRSSKVALCSHLGFNILWCARPDECCQTPRAPPALPRSHCTSLGNQGSLQWEVKENPFDNIYLWWPQWWAPPQGLSTSSIRANLGAVPWCDAVLY